MTSYNYFRNNRAENLQNRFSEAKNLPFLNGALQLVVTANFNSLHHD